MFLFSGAGSDAGQGERDGSSSKSKLLSADEEQEESNEDSKAIFWGGSERVYFTYKYREWKIMACRACLKLFVLFVILLLYLLFWYWFDEGIYILAGTSCAVCFLGGAQYLGPACAAGLAASLFKGVHLGAGPLHFDMHWDI